MKLSLSESDKKFLDQRIREAEKITKAQIVLAIVKRSDSYAEIPWKAFALGASVMGLIIFLTGVIQPVWVTKSTVLISVTVILGTGALLALLTVLSHRCAKLFLSEIRAEEEIRQYGESLFLNRELFATQDREGILVLVSLFERKVFILPDKGLVAQLQDNAVNNIISGMAPHLRKNEIRQAMETALDELVKLIKPSEYDGWIKSELSNEIIEEEGA